MPLFINTNLSSQNAQRHLASSARALENATERLSSGRRINRAADDAAGLAISNRLTTQVRGLAQAMRNGNDGISLIQTAEGALAESTNLLQRMRELAVQSANGIYSDQDRSTLDSEVQQLLAELDRIAATTSFNGREILNGSLAQVDLQVGAQADQIISFGIEAMDTAHLGMGSLGSDLVGDTLTLNGNGGLAYAIGADDVRINGQAIGTLAAGSTLAELVEQINQEISGIKASTLVEMEAGTVGTGVLGEGESLTLSLIKNDGNAASYTITDTGSLAELAEAINREAGALLTARLNDEGKLVLSGTGVASLSASDSTGTASGLSAGSISGGSTQQSVINGLSAYWIREAENLVSTFFGLSAPANTEIDLIFAETDGSLSGDVTGLTPGDQAGLVSDGAGGRVAAVWNDPANLKVIIDLADFVSAEGSAPLYNDRIIAHEMVHAVMAASVASGINSALPGWFSEGIAEFIHGADERVVGDIYANTPPSNPTSVGIAAIAAALATTPGSPSDSTGYSAGYVATKMLHEAIVANGGAGISDVIGALAGGQTLTAAITGLGINWGGGTSLADFEAYYASTADEYISDGFNGTNTYAGVSVGGISSGLDLVDTDTGSVAGSDYGGGTLTAASVLPNTSGGGPINFSLTLPDGYSAGSSGVSARLVLESTTGDGVEITRGQTGHLADLSYLGLQEMTEPGVIRGFGITSPEEAWAIGEIAINGVEVDVEGTDSLAGKIAAINAISSQTGVVAEAFASATLLLDNFDFDHWTSTNYGDFGINGITITGIGNAGDQDTMAELINDFSDQTGVGARVMGTSLILEARRSISIHDVPVLGPDAATAFGHASAGNAQILTSAVDASNGTAAAVTDGTYVEAGLELRSLDGSAIQLELGDAAISTTGLLPVNSTSGGSGTALRNLDVRTQSSAQKAITAVDRALETINATRSQLGAANNRLDFTLASLANILENSAGARARIMDTDYANETARLSAAQVKQQASSAILAQANARPREVLALLQ